MSRGTGDQFVRRRFAARLGRFRWAWSALAVCVVAAALVWVVLFSTWLGVGGVEVSGERTLSAGQVRAAADVSGGTPLARVDTDAVRRRVERLPRVESATVRRSWPRTLQVRVRERTAIAVVTGGGSKRALDRHGVLFKDVKKVPKHVPEVKVTADDEDRADAMTEVADVVAALDPAIARRVDRVEVASMDAIVLVLRNGDDVRWGSADEADRKARVLKTLLKLPASTYDVTAPERPTTKS